MTPLSVLYADRFVVAVDKPVGLPSQADRKGGDDVVSLLQRDHPYVALHHRLDQPVSGVLVVAIDPAANAGLAKAFRERLAHKTYVAILAGDGVPGTSFVWDRPIEGQPARTEGTIVAAQGGLLRAHLHPVTGRTHQLRIHAALAGTPLVGDRRYGGDAGRWADRLMLHAWRLELPHPVTGAPLAVESPVPQGFDAFVQIP